LSIIRKKSEAFGSMGSPMSEFKILKIDVENQIALLTISQPEVLNALNETTMEELESAFLNRLKEDDVGAIILTGAGEKAFVAGADIKELAQLNPLDARLKALRGHELWEVIEGFPKPVIAAINGYCLGGGDVSWLWPVICESPLRTLSSACRRSS